MLAIIVLWAGVTVALWQLCRRHGWPQSVYQDSLSLGLLAAATAAFFWPLLFGPNVWMPVGGGDLVSFLYPIYHFVARSLRLGDWPLWNPYLYAGAPFAADNQSGLFYPLNLVAFALKPELDYRALELLAVAHVYLAGAAAYLGLRYMQRKPLKHWAALAGAAAFMFSDLFVTHFGNLNMIASAAWLPLVFCAFRRGLDESRWRWSVGAGMVLGFSALAGHVQPFLYTGAALGLYWLHHVYAKRNAGWAELLCAVLLLALTGAVALGVAAPALLPAMEMSRLTLRADLSYADASQYSLPPVALIGLLTPEVFGRGPGGFWGPWPRVEVGYVGILPLILAGLALWLRRDRFTAFLSLLAVVALLLSLGDATLLHGLAYRFIPGFDLVRAPARTILILDWAIAALAALGLDALLRPISVRARAAWRVALHWIPILVFGSVLIILSLAYTSVMQGQGGDAGVWQRMLRGTSGLVLAAVFSACGVGLILMRAGRRIQPRTLGLLAFLLIVLDLSSLGSYTELERNDPLAGFDHPSAIAFLKQDPDYFRIDTRTEVWNVWQPNLSLLHGISDVWGIHNPLTLADYHRYWEGLGSRSTPLYDFLNAKYIVAHKDVVLDWDKFELAFDGDPTVNIYRNTRVLPRAYVVHQAWHASDQDGAFAAIHRDDFDPATMVVVEEGAALLVDPMAATPATITSYSNNEIRLQVKTQVPGYLVMSEVYYPGWKAEVNGGAAALLRANSAFRAVLLPAGTHDVRIYFQPLTLVMGVAISAATWLAVLVAVMLGVAKWRRASGSTKAPVAPTV